MPVPRVALMLLCIGAVQSASAQWADPLQAPACREAITALEAQERRALSTAAAQAKTALAAARRRAASACLTVRDDAVATPARTAQPPLAVPSIAGVPRALPLPGLAAPTAPRPPPSPPPVTIGSCDATGCWSSDGTRLQRVGPDLLGPRGFCTTAGAVLNCP